MFEPKLGASLHTIEENLTPEAIAAVADSRIATVEIHPKVFEGDSDGAMRAALKGMLRRTGIRPMTVHAPFGQPYDLSSPDDGTRREGVSVVLAAVDLAAEFGAPMVVVHASAEPVEPEERARRIERSRESLLRIGEHCTQTCRRAAVELLPRTCLGNTVDELLAILEGLPADVFGVCLDVNHLMDRMPALPQVIRALGPRLITTHLSDYDGVDEKHWLPGKGSIDWAAALAALKEIGYAGPMNFECGLPGATPAERIRALEASWDWLCRQMPG